MEFIETFTISSFWGPRYEAIDICADKIIEFLHSLSSYDESFTKWFQKGYSRKQALQHQVIPEHDSMVKFLSKESDDFGLVFDVWNGAKEDESVSLTITCGCSKPDFDNSVVFSLPYEGPASDRILRVESLLQLMTLIIQHWNPNSSILMSSEMKPLSGHYLNVGWLTYYSEIPSNILKQLSEFHVCEVPTGGRVIKLTDERYDSRNTQHVKIFNMLQKIFAKM